MQWIKVDVELIENQKVYKLASRMGWGVEETLGKLVKLWSWCLKFREDGILNNVEPFLIASKFGVDAKDSKAFIDTLIECGLVDKEPLRIHDWIEFAYGYLYAKYHSSNPKRLEQIEKLYQGCRKDNLEVDLVSSISNLKSKVSSLSSKEGDSKGKQDSNQSRKAMTIDERIAEVKKVFTDEEMIKSFKQAYPHVSLEQEQRKMEAWVRSRPEKSNKKNWKRFVNNWLASAEKEGVKDGRSGKDVEGHRGEAYRKATKVVDLS